MTVKTVAAHASWMLRGLAADATWLINNPPSSTAMRKQRDLPRVRPSRRRKLERNRNMMERLIIAIMLAGFAFAPAADAGGNATTGKAVFERTCRNCHSAEIGVNKVGPSLWN